jgi:hypothetical protein
VLIAGALIDLARGDHVECEPQRVTGDDRHWAYRIVNGRRPDFGIEFLVEHDVPLGYPQYQTRVVFSPRCTAGRGAYGHRSVFGQIRIGHDALFVPMSIIPDLEVSPPLETYLKAPGCPRGFLFPRFAVAGSMIYENTDCLTD